MAFFVKTKEEILQRVLAKIGDTTPITATSPGSVARAIVEAMTTELADFYNILDFNLSVSSIAKASGTTLDLMGSLYSVQRKSLSNLSTLNSELGVFYFYMDTPNSQQFQIPIGTTIFTGTNDLIGSTFVYKTTENVVFPVGRTRVFAGIKPAFADSVYAAGENTLVNHDFSPPTGITLRCTNPKAISAQTGYEDDESYRTRIIAAVRTAAGGTSDSCRLAALSIPNVRDVSIRSAPFGLGSFEALVVLEDDTNSGTTMASVRDALNKVRPVGVRLFLREPDKIMLDFTANIVVRQLTNINTDAIAARAQIAVLRYLNTMLVGTPIVYNQLIQAIMDSMPEALLDVIVVSYAVNGEEVVRKNYLPGPTEQIIPGYISVSVAQ